MQTTIDWSDRFSVGSERVDRQHRELLDQTNLLFDAMHAGAEPKRVEELLGFLHRHVALHFLSEERMMRRLDYPLEEEHRAMHWGIVEELIEVEKLHALEGASPAVIERLRAKVGPWLVAHFMGPDQHFATFLAKTGEENPPA